MSNPPLGIVLPLGYSLNDAPGSPMSPDRGPMGGGAFIVAQRGTVYVTPGPYLPIAKRYARIARNRSKSKPDRQGMRTHPLHSIGSSSVHFPCIEIRRAARPPQKGQNGYLAVRPGWRPSGVIAEARNARPSMSDMPWLGPARLPPSRSPRSIRPPRSVRAVSVMPEPRDRPVAAGVNPSATRLSEPGRARLGPWAAA